MSDESSVPIQQTTGGREVRTLQLTTIVDGVLKTVETQVVAIADANGNPLDDLVDVTWQRELLAEVTAIREGLELAIGRPLKGK